MPIQHAIWKVGDKPLPLSAGRLASEQKLEDMIMLDSRILSRDEGTASGTISIDIKVVNLYGDEVLKGIQL